MVAELSRPLPLDGNEFTFVCLATFIPVFAAIMFFYSRSQTFYYNLLFIVYWQNKLKYMQFIQSVLATVI
jgi:hypothetical protein